MRRIKKGLAILLAALLLGPVLPAFAAERESRTVSDGDAQFRTESPSVSGNQAAAAEDNLSVPYGGADIASGVSGGITWVIDGTGKLTLTGNGDFVHGPAITPTVNPTPWSAYREQIISAEVNVTGMTDASCLFLGCSNLRSVDLSGFDTSVVTHMTWMFSGCISLESLDLSNFKTENVIYMGRMFDECSSLVNLDLSSFKTENVTSMDCMFFGCSNLVSLDLSTFDTRNVTSMGWMFDGCNSLTSLNLSNFQTENVTDMQSMFSHCVSLKSLDLSNFNTENVTDMSDMFLSCHSLERLDISSFNTGNVTDMSGMFGNCSVSSLNLSNFDTSNVTNMANMFMSCIFNSLDVSNFDTKKVTNMANMFGGCYELSSLDVSNFDTGNVIDMLAMFWGCSNLTSLDLSNFKTEKVEVMGEMFGHCKGLTSLELSNFDTRNVTYMAYMFSECSSLTSLDVSSFRTENVTNMGSMFSNCSSLTSLDVSGFRTENVTNMGWMFSNCNNLDRLDLSTFDAKNVAETEGMLSGCSNLTSLQSPKNMHVPVELPIVLGCTWTLPDGTEVMELPKNRSDSVLLTRQGIAGNPDITTTTPDLNMTDVIRVKYVPYSYTVETNNVDPANAVTFSIVEGKLAEGLQIYPATGEIYGMPMEAGEFRVKVRADYSNPAYLPSYAELTLIVLDNTDDNVGIATDAGYDITQPVEGFNKNIVPGEGSQTLVSQGEFAEFLDVYLDGEKLNSGTEYTAEAGSTRITILNQTLARGGVGTHTLSVEFRTQDADRVLKRAAQNYRITDSDGNTSEGDNQGGNANNSGSNGTGNNNVWNMTGTGAGGDLNDKPEETLQDKIIIYSVLPGDNLWKIAVKFYGSGNYWMKIYNDNRAMIKNPGRIYTGQQLLIHLMEEKETETEEIEGEVYIIRSGDSLWKVAQRIYGDGKLWRKIYQANRDTVLNPGRLRAGQKLLIPEK